MAWIETYRIHTGDNAWKVATREGGVDRNVNVYGFDAVQVVATREGGVDRNSGVFLKAEGRLAVATREGGVDRNCVQATQGPDMCESPPTRVAWIETSPE